MTVISYQLSALRQGKNNLAAVRICENRYNQNIIYRDVQDEQDKGLKSKD